MSRLLTLCALGHARDHAPDPTRIPFSVYTGPMEHSSSLQMTGRLWPGAWSWVGRNRQPTAKPARRLAAGDAAPPRPEVEADASVPDAAAGRGPVTTAGHRSMAMERMLLVRAIRAARTANHPWRNESNSSWIWAPTCGSAAELLRGHFGSHCVRGSSLPSWRACAWSGPGGCRP